MPQTGAWLSRKKGRAYRAKRVNGYLTRKRPSAAKIGQQLWHVFASIILPEEEATPGVFCLFKLSISQWKRYLTEILAPRRLRGFQRHVFLSEGGCARRTPSGLAPRRIILQDLLQLGKKERKGFEFISLIFRLAALRAVVLETAKF